MNTLLTFFNKHKKTFIAGLTALILAGATAGFAHNIGDFQLGQSRAMALLDSDGKAAFPYIAVYPSKTGEVKGKVIYIPQIHRMPGSDMADSSNDPGFIVQKEIYNYLNILADQYGIKFFMTESGMYGELPQNYIAPVKKIINDQEKFKKEYQDFVESLGRSYQKYVPKLNRDVEKTFSLLERNIYLRGANIKFEAERGEEILTYGSQNPETYAQTVQLVRERLAIQKKLGNNDALVENVDIGDILMVLLKQKNVNLSTTELLKELLRQKNSVDLSNSFRQIKAEAQKNNDYKTMEQIERLESLAESMDQFLKQPISSLQSNSHTLQPLHLPQNPKDLKIKAMENQKKFNEIVVTKRSNEAVNYFIKGLNETDSQTGVLVYGAGHGKQIVEGLTSQGYEVTVISPELVHKKYPEF